MHDVGLVGGTFDRFHEGHSLLLRSTLELCEHVEIWLTSDSLAERKDPRICTWEERCRDIRDRMGPELSDRLSFYVLEDRHGPAPNHRVAGSITCTPENRPTCEEINSIRSGNGLQPLEIIEVPYFLAWDEDPISSSRIRDGEIDRSGLPWIPASFREGSMKLTTEVENQLKEPFGQLVAGPEENPSAAMIEVIRQIEPDFGPVIAVGDVTVRTMEELGRPADIALIDGLTKREPWEGSNSIDISAYDGILHCESPPGFLTPSLLEACEKAASSWLKDGQTNLIEVDGEEDLAPLLLHPLSPLGAVVLYGQPGKGVVVRRCSEETKNRCRNLLSCFKPAY